MKRFSFFFLLQFVWMASSMAQSGSYTSANYAGIGDLIFLTRAQTSGANFDTTGSGISWNYGALVGVSQTRLQFKNPTQTGFSILNWPFVFNSNNTNLASTDGQTRTVSALGISFTDPHDYFKKSSADLRQVASSYKLAFSSGAVNVRNQYTSSDILYKFPLTFGNPADSSVSGFETNIPGTYYQKQILKRKNVVDGSGTVQTPFGTFTNSLRMTSTVVQTDTFAILGTGIPITTRTYRELKWLNASQKYPILVVTQNKVGNAWVTSTVEYLDEEQFFQPNARFAYTPVTPVPGDTVRFQNLSTNSTTYHWNFGDSVSASNTSSEAHPQHIYNSPGTYLVNLIASNAQLSDTTQIPVVVTSRDTSTTIATPIVAPGTGTYPDPVMVSITCSTPGSSIYYTTTGNTPVIGTGFTKLYTGPFSLIQTGTVKAMAIKSGLPDSKVSSSYITITNPGIAATPVITPGTGTYSGLQMVQISCATSGATLYYTTNGNTPNLSTPNSFTKVYSGPFSINANATIKAIAVKTGILNSTVAVSSVTITNPTPTVATPVISPGTGTYGSAQSVRISCVTPNATIYYTTTGNVPVVGTGFTKIYTGPFSQSSSGTIRAMAMANGFVQSAVAVSYITIGAAREALSTVESFEVEQLDVFPNPSLDGIFTLIPSAKNQEQVKVRVLSLQGQVILDQTLQKSKAGFTLNLRHHPAGMYIATWEAGNQTLTKRLIKN